jgi:hypothetical protein
MLENGALKIIYHGTDEVMLVHEEIHNFHSPPNRPIVRMKKSRRLKWAGLATHIVKMRKVYKILVGKPKNRDCAEDLGVDDRMTLKLILRT